MFIDERSRIMYLRSKMLSGVLAGLIASPVFAVSSVTPLNGESAVIDYAFADVDISAVRVLSAEESAEVKGDFIPIILAPAVIAAAKAAGVGAVIGGAASAAIYASENAENLDKQELVNETIKGAVGGAIMGPAAGTAVPIVIRTTSFGLGLGWYASSARGEVTIIDCYEHPHAC
jgi:hypothetical protein